MKITSVKVTSTKIPTYRAHKMNIGTTSHQENVIVRIFTEDGLVGYGEAPHMVGHSMLGETPWTVRLILKDRLIPAILGKDPMAIESIWETLQKAVPGHYRAKSSIILACYDLAGKALKTPVYNLLGGKVRDGIPLSWSLPIAEPDVIVKEALEMAERGWTILKLKTGRTNPMDDVEAMKQVRKAVGPKMKIRADANQAYDPRTAIKVTQAMAEWDLEFMEQPCAAWDLDGMALVREASPVMIMADESLKTNPIDEIVRRRAMDALSIYVFDPGGIINSKKLAVIAELNHMKGYIGGALESIIGSSAGLHIAASSPAVSLGCEMSGQYLLTEDIGFEKIPMKDGCLVVPTEPGLGVNIDEAKIKHYEVDHSETFKL